MPPLRHQTVRFRGLPEKTVIADVRAFLQNRNIIAIASQALVGPICDQAESVLKQTTVSFDSSQDRCAQLLALSADRRRFTCSEGYFNSPGRTTIVEIDDHFYDLTTIFSANNPATGKPDIDIVTTHGLAGHAWNSFSTWAECKTGQYQEVNWLRDLLPNTLSEYTRKDGQRGIYARVMSFGYNANVWTDAKATADFTDATKNLILGLGRERREEPQRPLFFIAHSLGGIVVKQAIISLMNEAAGTDPTGVIPCPIKGCLFFGVPHKGSGAAGTFIPVLKALGNFFNVSSRNVEVLQRNSARLSDIADQFHFIRNDCDIAVVSCYELDTDLRHIVVPQESAVLYYQPDCPQPIGIYKSHREMVKFKSTSDQGFLNAVDSLATIARSVLTSPESPTFGVEPLSPNLGANLILDGREENILSGLRRFDTVFLIDDSGSMAGTRWQIVRAILERAAAIAVKYDDNGIDLHFLNDENHNRSHVTSATSVMQTFAAVTPSGGTPLGHQLQKHLQQYMQVYKEQESWKTYRTRQLNLIVITDGVPDEPYKRIKNTVVNTAKKLDRFEALDEQLGIQFCVIGDDPGVTDFYSNLDNEIEADEDLQRDMVDWVQCLSARDLHDQFFLKLLTGAWNKMVDEERLAGTTQATLPPAESPTSPPARFSRTSRVVTS